MKRISNKDLREAVLFIREFLNGKEAEHKGQRMQSEWIQRYVPIYMVADGPRALDLAGEVADGVIFMGGPSDFIKWKVDHIYRGAEKAKRDPATIDICARSYIYVTDSKEKAHRELAGFVPFGAHVLERTKGESGVAKVFERLEREQPGILDEMQRFQAAADEFRCSDGYNPWFEKMDAPYSSLMTQRMIDCVHLVGTVDEVCEKIDKLGRVGVTTVATATYTIVDKKRMITDVSQKIMPHF